jgi:predicted Rossmann fold nucleotide-binding protein DprA/Smf involved in DNA uptake
MPSQLHEEYAMTDKGMQDKYKQQLKLARERHGKPSEERNAERKERMRLRKALLDALASGPKTVPELAAEVNADPRQVLWYVAALRKYNEVADGPKQGDYIAYLRK